MFDLIIGSLLVFSWINCFLYALELAAVVYYFRKYGRDSLTLKGAVGACLVLDTLCTIANNVGVYRYTVTNWGVEAYLSQQEWPIPLYLICTGLVAAIVQSFLIIRYKNLSGNLIVCAPLFVLMLASLAGSLATGIMIIRASSLSARAALKIPVIIWFTLSAALDCSISGLLIWCLRSGKTQYKSSQIERLTSVTVQTGSMTAIVALVILAVYLDNPQGNVATGFGQCLGRLYTISMMWNLIIRKSIEEPKTPADTEAASQADDESTQDDKKVSSA